jgi:hypothetical protein
MIENIHHRPVLISKREGGIFSQKRIQSEYRVSGFLLGKPCAHKVSGFVLANPECEKDSEGPD